MKEIFFFFFTVRDFKHPLTVIKKNSFLQFKIKIPTAKPNTFSSDFQRCPKTFTDHNLDKRKRKRNAVTLLEWDQQMAPNGFWESFFKNG